MSRANPLWGAPRIHGELLKLGLTIAQRTIAKYRSGNTVCPAHFKAGLHIKTAGTTWLEEVIGLAEAKGKGLDQATSPGCAPQ